MLDENEQDPVTMKQKMLKTDQAASMGKRNRVNDSLTELF